VPEPKLESVFIVESVDSEDFYLRRLDGHAANEILKIIGTRTEYRVAFTKPFVERAISEAAEGNFQVLHFSSHGNDEEVILTNGVRLSWSEFAELIRPVSGLDRALVMSTCGGGDRELTKALVEAGVIFGWVFGSTADIVYFTDACLAWSILYNRLTDHGFERDELMKSLEAINAAIVGDFVYRRWDGKKYRRHPSSK
jgi:hypothetical protein